MLTPTRLVPEPADRRTAVAMTRLFYEYSQISLIAGAVMIAIRSGWVLIVAPSPWLLPWLAYCAGLFAWRHRWRRQCLRLDEDELARQWPLWRRRALLASLGVAAMWMGALWDDFRADDAHAQMFCTMVACITCVGSINVMAPMPRAYAAMAAPTLTLLALQFLMLHSWVGAGAALLVGVGLGLSVSLANRHARLLFHGHALRFEREELVARLEQTSRARSRFMAAASHDLRQPLHALGLLTGRLHDQIDPAGPAAETAGRIDQMVQALDSMVDGLLDVSRLDAGAVKPRLRDLPLGPLLDRLGASAAPMAEARGLRWRQRPCTCWVRSDPLQLERVLRNVVDNALRYTERGGVLLGCRRRGADVVVSVWDTGPGIAAADQQRVFEEFVQLGNPGRDRRQGLGLGLAIVSRLCGLLGHPLALRSRPGSGSCFSVRLPGVPAAAPAGPTGVGADGPSPQAGAFDWPLARLRVALVEDDDAVRDSTAALLRHWGCQVLCAADADALLARMAAQADWQPSAIVSDHRLAVGDGLEAIARLRRHCGRRVPALLLSGQPSAAPVDALTADGITAARKPLAAVSLRAWLSALAAADASEPVRP